MRFSWDVLNQNKLKSCGFQQTNNGMKKAPGLHPRAFFTWQEWRDSNPQPPVLETGALPIELHS